MAIGVKETQEIIRQAAVHSRNEPAVRAKLDPQEVGMATGPRYRRRALLRPVPIPDYLNSGETTPDEWQKLDDDIYKFLQLRRDQFGRLDAPPSQQFIAEMEAQLKFSDSRYELGGYLGLMRQAADLDQTRHTYVTSSEKSTFHAFARRITEGRKNGETFDPEMVKRYRDLLESNHPTTNRGLADLFRLVSRAARLPLLGGLGEAPSLSVAVVLQVVDLSTRFNQSSQDNLEFQVGPMDVFLGARTVLFNRSVNNPTLAIVKELVLNESGLYHDDLLELLQNVGVFGSELTLLIPESLTENGFDLQGCKYSAVELVIAAGNRLVKSQGPVERAMTTLSDAIVHKVQQQDSHKDRQIQSILTHFNHLLQGERRSAQRLTQDRQQARFDYMTAIQKAGQLAKGMQSGQYQAMQSGDQVARPILAPKGSARVTDAKDTEEDANASKAIPLAADSLREINQAKISMPSLATSHPASQLTVMPAAVVVGNISVAEYQTLLGIWDHALGRIRKKLTTKSPIFKSLVSQLAKVRSLDTCLAYGLTPAGGRATRRLANLIQSEEVRRRMGIPAEIADAMEIAFSMEYPAFLASLESLITALYEFRPGLQNLQFRLRDRLPAVRPGLVEMSRTIPREKTPDGKKPDGRETTLWADAAELDEVALRVLLGSIFLGMEMSNGQQGSTIAETFDKEGKLRFPDATSLATLGNSDPFLAFATLQWLGKKTLGASAMAGDLETTLLLFIRLTSDERNAMKKKYREWIGLGNRPASIIPGLGETRLRDGWRRGFERGYMAEVQGVWEVTEGIALDQRLLELLTDIQTDIDKACETLEGAKLHLTRERLARILD